MPSAQHLPSTPVSRRPEPYQIRTRSQTRAINAMVRPDSPSLVRSRTPASGDSTSSITPPRFIRTYSKHRSYRRDSAESILSDSGEGSQSTQGSLATALGDPDHILWSTPPNALTPVESASHRFLNMVKVFAEGIRSGTSLNASVTRKGFARRNQQASIGVVDESVWKETLDEFIATCDSIKARSKPLSTLEDRLAFVAEELVKKETLLKNVAQAREDAVVCDITWGLADNVVTACGHIFSEDGLHGYFQSAIVQELWRLDYFYRHIDIEGLTPNSFSRGFLIGLHERTGLFKPKYMCGTCRVVMTRAPVPCSAFSNLTTKLQELLGMKGGQEEHNGSPPCNMADYFVFFTSHPI